MSKYLVWVMVVAAGVGLMFFASYRRPGGPVSVSHAPIAIPTLTPKNLIPDQKLAPSNPPSGSITGSATCQLSGSINFINNNLYETKGAKIIYQNIDSTARLVYWKTSPGDEPFRIGPNIFSGLKLPTGEREVGVSLDKTPAAKSYTLTASVTYGVTDSRGVETIKTAPCSGSVKVTLP